MCSQSVLGERFSYNTVDQAFNANGINSFQHNIEFSYNLNKHPFFAYLTQPKKIWINQEASVVPPGVAPGPHSVQPQVEQGQPSWHLHLVWSLQAALAGAHVLAIMMIGGLSLVG